MNSSFGKELRPLLLPWTLCAVAALGHVSALTADGAWTGLRSALAAVALVFGCLVLSALPWGWEFQYRTWPWLLAQPIPRSRLWKNKFWAGAIAVLALVLVHGAFLARTLPGLRLEDILPWAGFVVATVCSAGFYVLNARSALGGMVMAGGAMLSVVLGVSGLVYAGRKVMGFAPDIPSQDQWILMAIYGSAGLAYAATALWWGWRLFARLELKETAGSRELALPGWMTSGSWRARLRCQPKGCLGNLIRKELGLQKPIFTLAAVFIVGWIMIVLLSFLEPVWGEAYLGILQGLNILYLSLVVLLAGCLSIGEEKALGLTAWQGTLPVSALRQWLVKLSVSSGMILVMGFGLAWLLASFSPVESRVGLAAWPHGEVANALKVLVPAAVLILGFWAAPHQESTLRAALVTLFLLIAFCVCANLGVHISERYFPRGLQSELFPGLIALTRPGPASMAAPEAIVLVTVVPGLVVVLFVALRQSLARFRHVHTSLRARFKDGALLALLVILAAFWCSDWLRSLGGG